MIATKQMAVLMAATILAAALSIAPFLGAEAQIAIEENGVGLVDHSNVEQTVVQEQNQEACTNIAPPVAGTLIPGGSVPSSVAQSNDCEVDQTQTASADLRARHDIAMNSIRNIRA
jgi:hypothetical protein